VAIPTLAFVLSAIVFAPLCSWLAMRRQRSWVVWFCFGAILGPVAAIILTVAPPGRCPACGAPTRGWPSACTRCHVAFRPVRWTPQTHTVEAATALPAPRSGDGNVGGVSWAAAPWTGSSARPRPLDPSADAGGSAILGSGVFVGGSVSLQIGSRYLLALSGSELRALGPVHLDPSTIAARIPLADTTATVVGDRLVISGRGDRDERSIAFSAVGLAPGVDLERTFEAVTGSEVLS
jgi:hypothetical protein